MNPFDHSTQLFVGIDPKARALVAMMDTQQVVHVAPRWQPRIYHGVLAQEVQRELTIVENKAGGRNFLYCLPRVRWPRLTRHGGAWLEVVSGVRSFVGSVRGEQGFGDYVMQVRRSAVSKLGGCVRFPRDFPANAERAFVLAEAMRWQYLHEPESIF